MQQIEWRRTQVLEFSSKGYSQSEISKILRVDKSIISRDIAYLREQSKQNIRRYVDVRSPEEYEKCLAGLTAILKEAWIASENALDRREKIQALELAKDCYSMKLELLTNATVVDDALKFVSTNREQTERAIAGNKILYNDKGRVDVQRTEEENSSTGINSTTNKIF